MEVDFTATEPKAHSTVLALMQKVINMAVGEIRSQFESIVEQNVIFMQPEAVAQRLPVIGFNLSAMCLGESVALREKMNSSTQKITIEKPEFSSHTRPAQLPSSTFDQNEFSPDTSPGHSSSDSEASIQLPSKKKRCRVQSEEENSTAGQYIDSPSAVDPVPRSGVTSSEPGKFVKLIEEVKEDKRNERRHKEFECKLVLRNLFLFKCVSGCIEWNVRMFRPEHIVFPLVNLKH